MIKNETWRVALDALLAKKVKTALTMLGIAVGSTCIVLVVTVSMIAKSYVIAQIVLLSGLGGLLGIIIAVSIKVFAEPPVPAEYNMPIPISLLSLIVAFVASCSTGVLFGYLPANRASRLQPTEALHHE